MKRIIISLLCLLLALSLFGCGAKPAEKVIENNAKPTEKAIEGNVTPYFEMSDGTWKCGDNTYKYRLEISGKMSNADKGMTFVYLSNIEEITFEQACKASGLSSNLDDYFDVKDAVLVEIETESTNQG